MVGAHLAGGLPLYASKRWARKALASAYADTAALRYLYEVSVLPGVVQELGADRLLFGSDYPLVKQSAALDEVRASGLDGADLQAVLGESARRLLGL